MIYKAPYSTGANGARTIKRSYNTRGLSLIMDHGRITFDLVKENNDTYVLYVSN